MITDKLAEITKFDLEHGPYFYGSAVTYLVLTQYKQDQLTWHPNDIDINCRTVDQMYELKAKFNPICTYYHEKERHVVAEMFGIHPLQMIWVIDGETITASIHEDVEAIDFQSTFTVTSCGYDGKTFSISRKSLNDIQMGLLRIDTDKHIRNSKGEEAILDLYKRYDLYVSRGFSDFAYHTLYDMNQVILNVNDVESIRHLMRDK